MYQRMWLDKNASEGKDIYHSSINVDVSCEDTIKNKNSIVDWVKNIFSKEKYQIIQIDNRLMMFSEEQCLIFGFWDGPSKFTMVDFYGPRKEVVEFTEKYAKEEPKTPSKIFWYYKDSQGKTHNTEIPITKYTADETFYPYLPKPLDTYISDYMNSTSSILILMGEPGTGKTSFVRHMICSIGKNSYYTFDDNIMNSDDFYIDFLTDKKTDFLIIEDADLLLNSRELNNKVMSKFLNASDGLVKTPNKKIVFTTNIQKISSIDDAIIRPGRCFDLLDFRRLTYAESLVIVDKYKLPELPKEKSYALSEIFNRKSEQSVKKKPMGF